MTLPGSQSEGLSGLVLGALLLLFSGLWLSVRGLLGALLRSHKSKGVSICVLLRSPVVSTGPEQRRQLEGRVEGREGGNSELSFLDAPSLVWGSMGPERKDVMTLTP